MRRSHAAPHSHRAQLMLRQHEREPGVSPHRNAARAFCTQPRGDAFTRGRAIVESRHFTLRVKVQLSIGIPMEHTIVEVLRGQAGRPIDTDRIEVIHEAEIVELEIPLAFPENAIERALMLNHRHHFAGVFSSPVANESHGLKERKASAKGAVSARLSTK
jgi:hypothetical protein